MTRSTVAVHFMTEGDILVRGTDDPVVALGHAVGEIDDVTPGWFSWDPTELWDLADAQDWCTSALSRARVGYYRIVNCLPSSRGADEGWSWAMHYATGPGRGAFRGVYFRDY